MKQRMPGIPRLDGVGKGQNEEGVRSNEGRNDATTIERRGSSGNGNVKAGRTEASVQLRWRYWELTRCQLA